MGFFNRLRFFIGIVVVICLVGTLFVYLSYTMSNITSKTATLETDAFAVKAEYNGVLKRQYVRPGDTVKEGDKLFEINSPSLTQALEDKQVSKSSLLSTVADNGNMILTANAPGTVQQINFANGAYIEADSDVATIETRNTQYVVAKYLLNAPDYARINRDNPVAVTLPDNSKFDARVFDIALEQDGEQVFTVVKARLPKDAKIPVTFRSGTPVTTSWQLNNSQWQNTLFRFVKQLIEPETAI